MTLVQEPAVQHWSSRRRRSTDPARAEQAEAGLSGFWQWQIDCKQQGQRGVIAAARHPMRVIRAVMDMRDLPQVDADVSESPHGRLIREHLERRMLGVLTLASSGVCVLPVPAAPGQYSEGPRRQTLRRKVRAAKRHGVTTHAVTVPAEQRLLAEALNRAVRAKSDERYRYDDDQRFLVGLGPWTVARDRDGQPLVIAVTPFDGEWALLSCFISLGDSPQHSDARYLLTEAVVERLGAEGVRYLMDGRSPRHLTNGLRHFQRMLGYRITRVVLSDTPR